MLWAQGCYLVTLTGFDGEVEAAGNVKGREEVEKNPGNQCKLRGQEAEEHREDGRLTREGCAVRARLCFEINEL